MWSRIAILAVAFLPLTAWAQVTILPSCTASGDCGVSDIIAAGLNIVEFLLGISGAVALAFLVWGGLGYILAGSNDQKVNTAKERIRDAIIGLIIIFTSGVIVRFTTDALRGTTGSICTESQFKNEQCLANVGDPCAPGSGANAHLWVLMPSGYDDPEQTKPTPSQMRCIKADGKANSPCEDLNEALAEINRKERYQCIRTDSPNSPPPSTCVRGLCGEAPSNFACCITAAQ